MQKVGRMSRKEELQRERKVTCSRNDDLERRVTGPESRKDQLKRKVYTMSEEG